MDALSEQIRRRRVVLVPYFIPGHLGPMLQIGSFLHSKGFSIVVVMPELNSPDPSIYPDFTFLHLPDNLAGSDTSVFNMTSLIHAINANCEALFHENMVRLLEEEEPVHGEVACIIYDPVMFFVDKVAKRLKVPTLMLRTHSATFVLSYHAILQLVEEKVLPLPESRLEDAVPAADPLRFRDLPLSATFSEYPEGVIDFVRSYVDIGSCTAVIWNTADMLEHSALQQVEQQYWKVPFFPIGPLHQIAPEILPPSIKEEDNDCLSWLDKQAPHSVIFVSFGSLAIIENKQLLELAWGLAKSEQPFLWVFRPSLLYSSDATASANRLSEDYLEAIGERGLIVKWAPQKKVLEHPSVGGFLTHCGWNSVVESISEGVPMICWPCFADQFIGARYATYVWKIGLELEHGTEAGSIEKAVKKLMVSEEGKEMRHKALEMKQELQNSIKCGGSSYESLNKMVAFINSLARKQ